MELFTSLVVKDGLLIGHNQVEKQKNEINQLNCVREFQTAPQETKNIHKKPKNSNAASQR